MDFETFKGHWRVCADATPLDAEALRTMVDAQTGEIRRRIRGRIRREAFVYVGIAALSAVAMIDRSSVVQLGTAAVLAALIGLVVVTLWVNERRIANAPVDQSTRQALRDLLGRVDVAARAYLDAYTAVVGAAIIGAAVAVLRRYGAGLLLGLVVAIATGAMWWVRASGRRYVDRLFRRDRADLVRCLTQLESEHG